MKRSMILILGLVLVLHTLAVADEVILKTGKVIKGEVTEETTGSVTVETRYGTLTIPRGDIESVRVERRRNELARTLEELAEKHREIAKWCEENGLEEQAGEKDS